jgi:hypothetical protein
VGLANAKWKGEMIPNAEDRIAMKNCGRFLEKGHQNNVNKCEGEEFSRLV